MNCLYMTGAVCTKREVSVCRGQLWPNENDDNLLVMTWK